MYIALQMYVIGDVTVVWHLYLFGYVLVVCVIVINVESSRRGAGITFTNRDCSSKTLWSPI